MDLTFIGVYLFICKHIYRAGLLYRQYRQMLGGEKRGEKIKS